MKNPFENLDKMLEHRLRLQIISVLAANESYDFNELKELLETTDGNLATHIKALEREKYLSVTKSFIERKPIFLDTDHTCRLESIPTNFLEGHAFLLRILGNGIINFQVT